MDFRSYSELYHHGIKGMHWGIRRYQNPDGTLTDAGKKRLRSLNEKYAQSQYLKKESEHMENLLNGKFNDDEKEYMPALEKSFIKFASHKGSIWRGLYNGIKPFNESFIKSTDKKVKKLFEEFSKQNIDLYEMEKLRPLYMGNTYVKRVFKQYDIKN